MPRDSGGTYTLPAGNPVVDGTVIESDWANDTMADFAVQLNNVFTRDGLLGPTAPVLFVNGTVALPGIAFQESPSTGFYRVAPSTVGLAIAGVAKQLWTPTAVSIAANTTITGNLGVTGTINATGAITLTGPLDIGGGTELLPGYTFTGDTNTGMYSPSAGFIGFTNDGVRSFYIDNTRRSIFEGVNVAASPQVVIKSGGDGYAIDLLGNVATGLSSLRFLNQGYTTAYLNISASSVSTVFNNVTGTPMVFQTNNIPRVSIGAVDGIVTFAAPTAGSHVLNGPISVTGATTSTGNITTTAGAFQGLNYWIQPNTTAAAGTVGITAPLGASTVYWGNATAGAGQMDLYAGGARQVLIDPFTTAVNFHVLFGSAGGDRITFEADGTDANIGMQWVAKGTGDYVWFGGTGGVHFHIVPGAAGTGATWLQVSGNTGVAPNYPTITSNATRMTMGVATRFIYTNGSTAGDIATSHIQIVNKNIGFVDAGVVSADNKVAELLWDVGTFNIRFVNDGYTDARSIMIAAGGVALGVTGIKFYTGAQDLTISMVSGGLGGGLGRVGIGSLTTPLGQLQVTGLGQVGPTTFDPSFGLTGGTLYLTDTGVAAGNGGCIMFGAFANTNVGKHFAAIKAYITDASSNTAGEIMICTKNSSADTGSTQALRVTADKVLYDSRNLPLARDAGATAGASGIPIGGIVLGHILDGATNVNALATHVVASSAGTNITIKGANSGTSLTITGGTWRNLGGVAGGLGGPTLWIRVA